MDSSARSFGSASTYLKLENQWAGIVQKGVDSIGGRSVTIGTTTVLRRGIAGRSGRR